MNDSQGDLLEVFGCLALNIGNELEETVKKMAMARSSLPKRVNPRNVPIFDDALIDQFIPLGLKLARKQYDIAKSSTVPRVPRTGRWEVIFGIPCQHEMRLLIQLGKKLYADRFH